jgi:tripartite-type tricarboxylate transporter receptor subunit TctC
MNNISRRKLGLALTFTTGIAVSIAVYDTVDAVEEKYPATLPLIEAGKLRALAVMAAKRLPMAKRLPILPNVPSIAESGVRGYDEVIWYGYAVLAGTPDPILKKLHDALRSAMLAPEFKRYVNQNGSELVASTREYAAQLMKSDYERYGQIVKELDLKVE